MGWYFELYKPITFNWYITNIKFRLYLFIKNGQGYFYLALIITNELLN